ncbi:NAD(P)/FAD-dependent oxidoreductase [Streptomyces sp. NPDC020951]|uniref:NAD(P)/FAD-dependent oxidoreductase n=1 Tax=Streptomyces sp. NPDC020951 TaxID=3365104 RepID=UPI0037B3F540
MTDSKRAVVLGAGLAGMLAAHVLAGHVDSVTVLERDTVPDGPYLRKGLPQARHAHLLMSGGARTIDGLLPGTTDRLLAAGAHRIGLPADVVSLTAYGWQQRFPGAEFMITCSRELLDWTVRDAVLRDPRITLLDGVDLLGPLSAAGRVTGVALQPRDGSAGPTELAADFVVDCTGRGSPAKKWLAELGLPPVREETVDSGLRYSSRIFRAPVGAERDFPVVSVYPDHRSGRPGQSAVLVPIEGGRWIVTVSGTRGAEPPGGEEGFAAFAGAVRHPIVGRLIASAEPVTEVQGSRSTHNRRLHYEQLTPWPEGFAVLGDALAAFNPVYGHGMSCAAHGVLALDGELRRLGGLAPQLARRVQRAVSAAIDDAWILATTQDLGYPGCRAEVTDARLANPSPAGRQFADLVSTAALSQPVVAAATMEVTTLSAPLTRLRAPEVLAAVQRLATGPVGGPAGRPVSAEPPLRKEESAFLGR